MTKTEHAVVLGEEYVDRHTGFQGRATSITYYEYSCERVALEACVEGDLKFEAFDIQRLVPADGTTTSTPIVPRGPVSGGDRPVVRQAGPVRR